MARPGTWTDEHQRVLMQRHAEGASLHSIAAELGKSKSTVGTHATAAGLRWPASHVIEAGESNQAYAKRMRAELARRMLEHAAKTVDKLDAEYVFVGGSKDGPMVLTLTEPDARAYRDYVAAAEALMRTATTALAADGDSSAQTRTVLGRLGRALGVKAPESDG